MTVILVRILGTVISAAMVLVSVAATMPQLIFENQRRLDILLRPDFALKISSYGGDVNVEPVEPGQQPVAAVNATWNLRKPSLMRSTPGRETGPIEGKLPAFPRPGAEAETGSTGPTEGKLPALQHLGPEAVAGSTGPQEVSLNCGDWSIGSWCGRGDWHVKAMPGEDLFVSSVAGDVTIGSMEARVQVRSAAGDVTVRRSTGDVQVRSSGGDVEVTGSAGNLDIQTSAGSVDAEPRVVGNIKIKTAAGDVRLALPAGDYEIRTNSSLGQVTSEFPSTTGALRVIEVKTAAGNIEIVKAADR